MHLQSTIAFSIDFAFKEGSLRPRILVAHVEQKENPTYIFHLKCKLKGRYAGARSRHLGRHPPSNYASRQPHGKESAAPHAHEGSHSIILHVEYCLFVCSEY